MWDNDVSTKGTGSASRPSTRSPSGSNVERHTLNYSSVPPKARGRWLRATLPALALAVGIFALGVFAAGGATLLPEGLLPPAKAPIELDGDLIPELQQLSDLERAQEGEAAAISKLRKKKASDRSVDETLALAEAELEQARDEVRLLGKRLRKERPANISPEEIQEILELVGDEKTYQAALGALAHIENFLGADLIYRASREHKRKPHVVELAHTLLATNEIRKRASPAMGVVIDAMNAETCEQARSALQKAENEGDRRSVRHLAKFADRTGCGDRKLEDCYTCLRADTLLVDAVRLARERIEPY